MPNADEKTQQELVEWVASCAKDPLRFVMGAFPWGVEGSPLEKWDGPDEWQVRVLKDLGHALQYGWVENRGVKIDCSSVIPIAVSSGHGIGKGALFAMLNIWFQSTQEFAQGVFTANTEIQLKAKTWKELAKWHSMSITSHWFDWKATQYKCKAAPERWNAIAQPWSKEKPEGFAGTHGHAVMMGFDEASAIYSGIFDVAWGALTDAGAIRIFFVAGNPTRSSGRFAECFRKERDRWIKYEIDSRTARHADTNLVTGWIKDYGLESDFVRVRVLGKFPRGGVLQFIGHGEVEPALGKVLDPNTYAYSPKIVGVDVARSGDDRSCIIRRQGRAAFGLKKFRVSGDMLTQKVAGAVASEIKAWNPDMVFIDMGNTGAAVVDVLTGWGHGERITGVWFGGASDDPGCKNKRADMWFQMRKWLRNGSIPNDNELRDDLTAPDKINNTDDGLILLEPKESMRKRGLPSPDAADALALTFAYPVDSRQWNQVNMGIPGAPSDGRPKTDYDELGL